MPHLSSALSGHAWGDSLVPHSTTMLDSLWMPTRPDTITPNRATSYMELHAPPANYTKESAGYVVCGRHISNLWSGLRVALPAAVGSVERQGEV
jgi:hypothetical protein